MNKARTYNLLDIKEAVEIKPQDYSKAINTKDEQSDPSRQRKAKDYDPSTTWHITVMAKKKGIDHVLLWLSRFLFVQVTLPTKTNTQLIQLILNRIHYLILFF